MRALRAPLWRKRTFCILTIMTQLLTIMPTVHNASLCLYKKIGAIVSLAKLAQPSEVSLTKNSELRFFHSAPNLPVHYGCHGITLYV